jgi:hypothetical protein
MSLAAIALLALAFGLVAFDWITFNGKNRRVLLLEALAMIVGAFFIAFPHRATALAHIVGIGRGADFLLYPIVIWLVRDSLLLRRQRLEDAERITHLARALALVETRRIEVVDHSTGDAPAQSSEVSAS